jgi:hypothetical protein
VRVAGDEGRPGDHVSAGHLVEQLPRVSRKPAPQRQVRQGGGVDSGGGEAELEEHGVEWPNVGRGAAGGRRLQRGGEGRGVPRRRGRALPLP